MTGTPTGAGTPAVLATGIDVTLGGHQILQGVDLRVERGEVVALLGANGSGKSTLVRALLGIAPRTAGEVHLLGSRLGNGVPWDRVGYVPQRLPVGAGVPATAVEVVVSGLVHGRTLRPPRDARRRALAALEQVGMAAHAKRSVLQMSGGQQQRVLIARALVREPDLLVLDEPTSGIDLPTQETFVATVRALHERGGTVLVILHELGSFADLIDRAVALRHGRVVYDGPPPSARGEHADHAHDHTHPHADPAQPGAGSTGLSMEVLP
ncbi:metal ABC transporter ATP-binding protein [Cellulomonas triticagri]|uniref:ATP-binding cassette domain-containing protein n=1 Tax=Cellulomonas triticagri TaxID=2483352 RepID=A0A3M2JU00_9CELL|nr:ATP-binding cassette domain-containing protein [Cellulomonas triticagri]RMI13638.1 ATP-binding cassette domain-containing protein [Cellulomonas triticagri]